MVPNGWKEGRVRDLIKSLNAGVSVNSEDDGNLNSSYKILKTSCVSKGVFDPNETKSVVEEIEISRLKEPVLGDSIIISRMNTPALVGANGYIENGIDNTYLPDRLWQAKPKSNDVNMKWLGYWFASSHTRYTLSSTATGTSGSMKNITKSDVLNIKIDIPSLPEQRKIAKILSIWDKAISAAERLIDNSKQQKKALMQQLLTGKKRLLDDSGKPFEGEWLFSTFSEVFKVANNKKTQIKSGDYLESGNIPIVDQGKQLISGYTNNVEKYDDIPVIIFGDHTRIVKWVDFEFAQGADGTQVLKATKRFDTKFSYYLLSNTDIPNLGYSRHMRELKEKDFKHPNSIKEQQKIALVLTNADNEIGLLEQQLADLKQEKKALMQQLLTGKRRVKV
ncbi:restriction endonuclease subunit S [Proteus sp. NGCRVN-01]|uniref:restriction endonuclease subunit S n=1 Tax=Proteus sp. NGCRVN-01 TaxID=3380534 RepID=UPI00387135BA